MESVTYKNLNFNVWVRQPSAVSFFLPCMLTDRRV